MNPGPPSDFFRGITHLTFDCYGTLIDWEAGLLAALKPMVGRLDVTGRPTWEQVLQSFVRHEARAEMAPWRSYREVLAEVLASLAADWRLELRPAERELLADSLSSWPPFPDTVVTLRRLQERFKLVIVSNTDDALFAGTARRLGVAFDEVVTAEQVRSYKPGEAHFREALRRLQVPVHQVLHVAQSLYHDHVPARRLGFRTVWVRRPSLLAATGLGPAAQATPDLTVTSLAELA